MQTNQFAPFAIHRYPTQWIEPIVVADGRTVLVRPVLPQDAELQRAFVRSLSPASRMRRFHGPVNDLPEATARYMTEVDFETHVALLGAVFRRGTEIQVAEARWVRREDEPEVADFAIAVADDWQRLGIATRMMDKLVASAEDANVQRLSGDILADNVPMRRWLQRGGWRIRRDWSDASILTAELDLGSAVHAVGTAYFSGAAQ